MRPTISQYESLTLSFLTSLSKKISQVKQDIEDLYREYAE